MGRHRTDSLFALDPPEPEIPSSHTVRVAFDAAADMEFDYAVPDDLWPIRPGMRVQVPFGRGDKLRTAFCVDTDAGTDEKSTDERREPKKRFRLKHVRHIVDAEPLVNDQLLELARWISEYYVCPLGQVLAAMVPAAVKKGAGVKTLQHVFLHQTEFEAIEKLRGRRQKDIVSLLQQRDATDRSSAVEVAGLLEKIGCSREPLKRLAERGIVRIVEETTLVALPAVPDCLLREPQPVELNADQRQAMDHITSKIAHERFSVSLLYGVTDSGKTELYIRAIQQVLSTGRTAIVLLPEIALTAQTIQRFSARFERIAVMHSGLTGPQRNAQWQKIKSGRAEVVIGARSAIFAPVDRLGLIVVDEEHEPSYKQDTAPRYNGRDVAIKRAHLAGAHCILGSATPSLESLCNCRTKKHFDLIRLPKRVMDLPMPEMKLIDMRGEASTRRGVQLLSEPLARQLGEVLARGEQAILLLNRRGYSNFVFCPSCKHTLHCRNCDVTLTFHRSNRSRARQLQTVTGGHMRRGYAVCHYCLSRTLVPDTCPVCRSRMTMIGLGSQRLEEELKQRWPDSRTVRIDSDSMGSRDYYALLRDFSEGHIDILAGTQMLAKGLHFPNVTLVGIISADTSLYIPDFRANERTFQLISQVAGRTGRSEKKGTVFVQTFLPSQPAIQYAIENDFAGFVAEELTHRRACNLPPFWKFAIVRMRDMNFERLEAACKAMRSRINGIIGRHELNILVRGPMPSTISRLQRFHRMQIIVQAPDAGTIHALFSRPRREPPLRPAVKVAIDVDPVNLL